MSVKPIFLYPRKKYINKERIGSESFFIPYVYFYLESSAGKKWFTIEDIPLNHLNLSTLILGEPDKYNKPSIYNLFCVYEHLKNIDLEKSKPILLDWKNSIIDGHFRILKALIEQKETIKVYRIKEGFDMDNEFLNWYHYQMSSISNIENFYDNNGILK